MGDSSIASSHYLDVSSQIFSDQIIADRRLCLSQIAFIAALQDRRSLQFVKLFVCCLCDVAICDVAHRPLEIS